jgi:THO complex subunit 1
MTEKYRSHPPAPETLVKDVKNVDLDLEMATTDGERQELENAKMSKTWRALRLMSKTKLKVFDKVDDGQNLDCFLQSQQGTEDNGPEAQAMTGIESGAEAEVEIQNGPSDDVPSGTTPNISE